MLPWLYAQERQPHLIPRWEKSGAQYRVTHKPSPRDKDILLYFYFFLQPLLSSWSDSIWDRWGKKRAWGRLSSLVMRAVFKWDVFLSQPQFNLRVMWSLSNANFSRSYFITNGTHESWRLSDWHCWESSQGNDWKHASLLRTEIMKMILTVWNWMPFFTKMLWEHSHILRMTRQRLYNADGRSNHKYSKAETSLLLFPLLLWSSNVSNVT